MKHLNKIILLIPVILCVLMHIAHEEMGNSNAFEDITMYTSVALLAVSVYSWITVYTSYKLSRRSTFIDRAIAALYTAATILVFIMFLRAI